MSIFTTIGSGAWRAVGVALEALRISSKAADIAGVDSATAAFDAAVLAGWP